MGKKQKIPQLLRYLLVCISFTLCLTGKAFCVEITGTPPELLFKNSDFELGSLDNWTPMGNAFDVQPVMGDNAALRGKPANPQGTWWVGTYENYNGKTGSPGAKQGDDKTGTLTSRTFTIRKKYINFLIGGGCHPGTCTVEIWVGNKLFYSETGGDAESMKLCSVDVSSCRDAEAHIVIRDEETGSWGHINADWFTTTDRRLAQTFSFSKNITVNRKYLLVPVRNRSQKIDSDRQIFQLMNGTKLLGEFIVKLPLNGTSPDWTAAWPVDRFDGMDITLKSKTKISDQYTNALEQIRLSDEKPACSDDYTLPYRDQFHYSQRVGWNNDVNGLVYNNGIYNLYYQYNPFDIWWDNMHWGHATSTDLVHWTEQDIALFPNSLSDMAYSGGGFMDPSDSAGIAPGGVVPQYAAFTSTGRGECLAYSLDGGFTFTELPENPVVKHHGRDPDIIWYEPEQKWVMVLYDITDEILDPPPLEDTPDNMLHDSVAFYSSENLRDWTFESRFVSENRRATHECPELFKMSVEGHPVETRWILYGVYNQYFIGEFDGHRFVPESGPFPGEKGIARAAEIVRDAPDGRKIQIAWAIKGRYQNLWPGQRYSQGFLLPAEITLRETPNGLRLFFNPVGEVNSLHGRQLVSIRDPSQKDVDRILKEQAGKLMDVMISYTLESGAELTLTVNGQPVSSSESGSIRVLSDRTITEAFVNQGEQALSYRRPENTFDDTACGIDITGNGSIKQLTIYEMNSIW